VLRHTGTQTRLRSGSVGVVTDRDQQRDGGVWSQSVAVEKRGSLLGHDVAGLCLEMLDLDTEVLDEPGGAKTGQPLP
jgi:hypothetical protein